MHRKLTWLQRGFPLGTAVTGCLRSSPLRLSRLLTPPRQAQEDAHEPAR
jgi:hypothetical protein